ncbi:hypothetical protein [Actinomycetospora soli]|uniref:hypothetical protein n=1 Tax=Actinomycetospora soli TaxID=2893887 RepID=UPI001E63AC09|nr:hypothetical protein [Actinomycetospora soli]MCD2191437.1 hypothetical protein [Actinomycetospora soli]
MTTPTDRSVTALVVAVVVGYALLAWAGVAPGLNLLGGLLGLVLALGVAAVQLGYVSRPGVARSREATAVALLALACLVAVPVVALGLGWIAFAGFLAGSLRLLLPARAGTAGFAVVVVAVGLVVGLAGSAPVFAVLTAAVGTVVTGLVIEGLTRWWQLTAARAVVPVAALPGGTPTPAAESPEREAPERESPEQESTERGPTDGGSPEHAEPGPAVPKPAEAPRSAVARELVAGRSRLDAAGVELAVLGEDAALPDDVDGLFAALVDVAVGHAARHPDASTCHVTIARRGAEARIVVTHDGATDDPRAEDFEALGERFEDRDGSVLAERDDEQFTVEGRLPLET